MTSMNFHKVRDYVHVVQDQVRIEGQGVDAIKFEVPT